jgi:hypothetical protein
MVENFESAGLSEVWGYYITPFFEREASKFSKSGILRISIQILEALEAVH